MWQCCVWLGLVIYTTLLDHPSSLWEVRSCDPHTHSVYSTPHTGPPSAPTPPLNPHHTTLTATSFTAVWDTPTFDGGLPLRNYSIEILVLENTFCPVNYIWSVAVSGVEPTATVAMVTGLVPSYNYQFRVYGFNYEHRSASSSVVELATLGSGKQPLYIHALVLMQ